MNTHLTADGEWLTVIQLPPCAPHLNLLECLWSVLRRTSQANRAFADPDHLITASQRGLHQLQYRHHAFDGCLTGTGLRKPP
ncbi:transposase [Streptomyces griseorubiginosus]